MTNIFPVQTMPFLTSSTEDPFLKKKMAQRTAQHQLRKLHTIEEIEGSIATVDSTRFINFSSNDYLGLSQHPHLIQRAEEYLRKYGTGAGASRLISGNHLFHIELEQALAHCYGSEAILLFNSGFQANSTLIPALIDRDGALFADRSCHSSIVHGAVHSQAQLFRYRHQNLDHLEELLYKHSESFSRILILTETLFSMEGDVTDIDRLQQLAEKYRAHLYVDDAHALGVIGRDGMGVAAFKPEISYRIGTFGKAFGSFGAFIACSNETKDYLVNFCKGFIYTTALPPSVIGAAMGAVELIPSLANERRELLRLAHLLREGLKARKLQTIDADSQIVPWVIGEEEEGIRCAEELKALGILTTVIRPPTVARGMTLIRFTLTKHHNETHIRQLLKAIDGCSFLARMGI